LLAEKIVSMSTRVSALKSASVSAHVDPLGGSPVREPASKQARVALDIASPSPSLAPPGFGPEGSAVVGGVPGVEGAGEAGVGATGLAGAPGVLGEGGVTNGGRKEGDVSLSLTCYLRCGT